MHEKILPGGTAADLFSDLRTAIQNSGFFIGFANGGHAKGAGAIDTDAALHVFKQFAHGGSGKIALWHNTAVSEINSATGKII